MFYFAYGSNLNLPDLNRWCSEQSEQGDFLEFYDTGVLKDFELAFTLDSVNRCGGVLDVVPKADATATGALFNVVRNEGWRLLDRKEGVPVCYMPMVVQIERPCGSVVTATTYSVVPDRREAFVQPNQHYVDVVLAGLSHWEMDDRHVRNAVKGNQA